MPGLGHTVADLLARARAAGGASQAASGAEGAQVGLRPVADFGANPGALRMWFYEPEGLAPRSPLVVVLHGCGQTAAGYAAGAGWLELADRYGFAVLCPEQVRANNANLCFNWFEDGDIRRDGGEAASIAQMVRHAIVDFDVDPRRVFVTGLSAGGAMTAVMLAAYPELFAAGAVIAGLPYGAASGIGPALAAMAGVPKLSAKAWGDKVRSAAPRPDRWPRISIWHGDADTTVAPVAAQALALQWGEVHGAKRSVARPGLTARHTHVALLRPDGSVGVDLHRVAGLGHGAPIAASGEEGCGSPAPWILEAGLSSSLEIARSWELVGARRPAAAAHPSARSPDARGGPGLKRPRLVQDVGDTIAQALRGAGLMR